MVLIYMRHSNDAEEDATYQHDARLTDRGIDKCRTKAIEMAQKYGIPSVIVTSPFYRARQTTKYLRRALKKQYGVSVKIKIDVKLGRYFTTSQQEKPDVRRDTMSFGPIIEETKEELELRVANHLKKVTSKGYHRRREVIWCISHGLVLKRLLERAGQHAPEKVGFLQYFAL